MFVSMCIYYLTSKLIVKIFKYQRLNNFTDKNALFIWLKWFWPCFSRAFYLQTNIVCHHHIVTYTYLHLQLGFICFSVYVCTFIFFFPFWFSIPFSSELFVYLFCVCLFFIFIFVCCIWKGYVVVSLVNGNDVYRYLVQSLSTKIFEFLAQKETLHF